MLISRPHVARCDRAVGSVAPNGIVNVSVLYDVSQINFQGIYTADILITTDARPLAKVGSHRFSDTGSTGALIKTSSRGRGVIMEGLTIDDTSP